MSESLCPASIHLSFHLTSTNTPNVERCCLWHLSWVSMFATMMAVAEGCEAS